MELSYSVQDWSIKLYRKVNFHSRAIVYQELEKFNCSFSAEAEWIHGNMIRKGAFSDHVSMKSWIDRQEKLEKGKQEWRFCRHGGIVQAIVDKYIE